MKYLISIRGIEMRIKKNKRITICSGKFYYYFEITGLITFVALSEDFFFIHS